MKTKKKKKKDAVVAECFAARDRILDKWLAVAQEAQHLRDENARLRQLIKAFKEEKKGGASAVPQGTAAHEVSRMNFPHIRPYRTNHKRLSRGAKWIAQWKYDTACAYFANFNDEQLKWLLGQMKTKEYLLIPQNPVRLECADLLWIVKAIRKERKAA